MVNSWELIIASAPLGQVKHNIFKTNTSAMYRCSHNCFDFTESILLGCCRRPSDEFLQLSAFLRDEQ